MSEPMKEQPDWDAIAQEADNLPIQSVRSFAAQAEEANTAAGGLSTFAGFFMDRNGDYQFRRNGNRMAALGGLRIMQQLIEHAMIEEIEEG